MCGNREFSFYNYVNLQINVVICKFLKGFYFVISHQQLFSYYLGILHLILLNILSHFHFIRPFFKHLYYFTLIDFIYSFIHSLLTETGSINECQRSLFLWSEFLHAITVTANIRAHHKTTWRLEWPCFSKWRLALPQFLLGWLHKMLFYPCF